MSGNLSGAPSGFWRSRWMWLGVSVVLAIAFGVAFIQWLENSGPRPIEGMIQCTSGNPIVGVWVVDRSSADSDFATWRPDPIEPSEGRFRRDVYGRQYAVHVGCGGDAKYWEENVRSALLSDDIVNLICHDVPREDNFGRCVTHPVRSQGGGS